MNQHTHTHLLVYGLLRKGLSMDGLMNAAEPLGIRRIPGFDLYDLGDYPGAVPGTGVLIAELYRIPNSPAAFEALDAAEGVDDEPPLYHRLCVTIPEAEETSASAWLYVYARSVEDAARIESGDWLNR